MMRFMAAANELDAIQVAAQYSSGALSPVEVTRAWNASRPGNRA